MQSRHSEDIILLVGERDHEFAQVSPQPLVPEYVFQGDEVLQHLIPDGLVVVKRPTLMDGFVEVCICVPADDLQELRNHGHDLQAYSPLLLVLEVLHEGEDVLAAQSRPKDLGE